MRSRPSEADASLITTLASDGLFVSPTQMERWRGRGLLPRAVVTRETFGGSRVRAHTDDVVEACRVLAEVSGRGHPWQDGAIVLFENDFTLSTAAVRQGASHLFETSLRPFRRAWRFAEVGVELDADPGEWVADVADAAARRTGRAIARTIREEIALAHPHISLPELREATKTAVIWRIADICAPTHLDDRQRTWARHGMDEPLDPLADVMIPLPSERAACVETLTWAEASLARSSLLLEDHPMLESRWLLDLATWRVTGWRLHEDFSDPQRPLTDARLHEHLKAVREEYAERSADSPAGRDQMGSDVDEATV
jgi:hypothetical protein